MLICFHGTDTYRIRQAVGDVLDSFRDDRGTAVHPVRIDCAQTGAAEELERQFKYPSFFGDRKYIIAMNAVHPVMQDVIDRFDPAALDDVVLIAVQDTAVKGADAGILKALIRSADRHEEFVPLKGVPLQTWVAGFCEARRISIGPDAIREVIRRTEGDSGLLACELEKLCAYAGDGPLTGSMVELLTPERPGRDEWELANALATYDKRSMVAALWRKIHEGVPEQMLIGSLAAGLRNLLIIKSLNARRMSPAVIAKRAGLHPFVVSKTLRGAAAADAQRVRSAHLSLARLDRDAKDGRADAVDGMFSILLSV